MPPLFPLRPASSGLWPRISSLPLSCRPGRAGARERGLWPMPFGVSPPGADLTLRSGWAGDHSSLDGACPALLRSPGRDIPPTPTRQPCIQGAVWCGEVTSCPA